jgi:antirestriction protein ArdC
MASERVRQVMDATVTALCARMEAGDLGSWRMPWHSVGNDLMRPRSVKGHAYSGGNRIALFLDAMVRGYSEGTWATYKQWREVGGQVRKGEHGTPIVVFSQRTREATVRFYVVRTVFNSAQQDGWTPPAVTEGLDEAQRIATAEAWTNRVIAGGDARVEHGGNRAYYRPRDDVIRLPHFNQFKDPVDFYTTSWHELTHWTAPRVGREARFERWGDDAYAGEELVAELGAAFCCADQGLAATPREDHAQYLTSWLRALRAEPARLWTAARAAEAAVIYLGDLAARVEGPEPGTPAPSTAVDDRAGSNRSGAAGALLDRLPATPDPPSLGI